MSEQYIRNGGTYGPRAKLVKCLVTIKVPKCPYRVEWLTDIWFNKYKKKFGPTNIKRNGYMLKRRLSTLKLSRLTRDPS